MGWTQPICAECWYELNPERKPVMVVDGELEKCYRCGGDTVSGIYVRVDPATIAQGEKDECP